MTYLDEAKIDEHIAKATEARNLANRAGAIDSIGGFQGTSTPKSTGILDWAKSFFKTPKTQFATDQLVESIGGIALWEKQLEDAKKLNVPTAPIQAEIDRLKGLATSHAEEVIPQMHAAKIEHLNAQRALGEAQLNALKEARELHRVAYAKAKDDAARKLSVEKLEATEKAITEKFAPELESHASVVTKITGLEGQIEKHVGINVADHMAKVNAAVPAVNGTAADAEKSGFKGLKFLDRVKQNAFKGGVKGMAKVGFGAAFTLDGLRRIKNAFIPGNGPDGQPQPMDLTQAVIGTVEGAGGLFLAQHGHSKA